MMSTARYDRRTVGLVDLQASGGANGGGTPPEVGEVDAELTIVEGTIGCTPTSVPMVFIVFSRDSWGS